MEVFSYFARRRVTAMLTAYGVLKELQGEQSFINASLFRQKPQPPARGARPLVGFKDRLRVG